MIGNLIGAAGSLLGGIFGQRSQEKMAEKNIQLQKQFAQEGIQWKVNDAKAAGIHPLYALGAQTHSFAPVSVGDSLGPALSNMGQDIGRAVNAKLDSGSRVQTALSALAVERATLENDLLRSQIRRNNMPGTPPAAPGVSPSLIPGQGDATIPSVPGTIVDEPLTRSGVAPSVGYAEAGAIPGVGYDYTGRGHYPIPSKDVKNRIEDSPYEWVHFMNNVVLPAFGVNMMPPEHLVRRLPYQMWHMHPIDGYKRIPDPTHDRRGRTRYFSPNRRLY